MNCQMMNCACKRRYGAVLLCEAKSMPTVMLTSTRLSCAVDMAHRGAAAPQIAIEPDLQSHRPFWKIW